MRRMHRIVSATVLIALSGAIAGCSSSVSNWDPMDMLDFLDTKKKLPGDRKPVFPEGVPGVEQGVPKELYKGNVEQQQLQQQQQEAAVVASPPPPADEAKSAKRSAKSRKGKPTTVSAAPAQDPAAGQEPDAAASEEEGAAAVPPAPKPKKLARRRTTSLPNDDPAQGGQPAQPADSSFPAPVPSGSFQR